MTAEEDAGWTKRPGAGWSLETGDRTPGALVVRRLRSHNFIELMFLSLVVGEFERLLWRSVEVVTKCVEGGSFRGSLGSDWLAQRMRYVFR